MKALKTKVILSGIVLVFAFIATIGTTFAWFTVSQTATVEEMTLNVTAAENLVILPVDSDFTYDIDGDGANTSGDYDLATSSNYYTTITNQELYNAGYLADTFTGSYATLDLAPDTGLWRLQPSTVIDPEYAGFNSKDLASIDVGNRSLTNLSVEGTDFNSSNGHYIQLNFWLFSQSENAETVELSNFDVTTSETGAKAAVINSVRMSVWLDDSIAPGASAIGSSTTEGDSFVFGLDNDYGYVFTGIDYTITDQNSLQDVADNGTWTGTPSASLATDASAAVNTSTTGVTLFTIQPSVPTYVTVIIYIEGWDAQADNDITESSFNISFGFTYGA